LARGSNATGNRGLFVQDRTILFLGNLNKAHQKKNISFGRRRRTARDVTRIEVFVFNAIGNQRSALGMRHTLPFSNLHFVHLRLHAKQRLQRARPPDADAALPAPGACVTQGHHS
jgi:hypothetical protein